MTPHQDTPPEADALQRLFGGETLAAINGVSQERLEEAYQEACDAIGREEFEDALETLLFLVTNDAYDFRFQFGYALCLHQLGHVAEAARHYGLAWMLDCSDAAAAFRLGECHAALGDREAAAEAFETAIQLCGPPELKADLRHAAEAALLRLNS